MTPEGYLICFDVPIARTGMQQYLRSELGITDDDPNGIVEVIRTEDEVFSDACIASFEGKPVTDDHPPVNVDTQNITAYNCGHAQHIRRGQGEESDLILADLFITDKQLIEEIKNGLLRLQLRPGRSGPHLSTLHSRQPRRCRSVRQSWSPRCY